MNMHETNPSCCSRGLTPAQSAVRAIAWGEVFILIPMHAFWMLFRCVPFVAENTASAVVAAMPIMVLVLAGLGMLAPRIRATIVRAEWLYHLTAAVGMLLLLFYVTLRDPFGPGLPITWPLCFWSVCMTFAALGNLALHVRIRAEAGPSVRSSLPVGVLTTAAMWAGMAWLASSMDWAPYFWTASLAFHAVMAPCSRRASSTLAGTGNRRKSAIALVESIFIASLMLAAALRVISTCSMLGRAEIKYLDFVNIAAHPAFFAGIVLALAAGRLRVGFVAHAVVAGVFLFTGEATAWPIALVFGYCLPALYMAAVRQGALGYTLALPAVAAVWGFGMLGFMLAGPILIYGIGQDFAKDLVAKLHIVAPVLYALWLSVMGCNVWWTKRHAGAAKCESHAVSGYAAVFAYLAAWIVIAAPVTYFVSATMSPSVALTRADRIEVGEPAGVCHAGYSKSDEEYANLDRLGVRLMRIDFHWHRIQKDADTWDFSRYDTYLDAAEKHNVKVLALLVFDNNAVETNERGASREHYMAPEDVPLYLEYIRRTVTRYKDRVYAWELWNEPDMPRFWNGPLEEVYELIRLAGQTVREVHPEAILLGPAATSPLGAYSAPCIEAIHATGGLEAVDHPTMHTYISDPRGYYGEYARIQTVAAKYGHTGSVWITELGDPDAGSYPWRGSRDHLAVHAIKSYTIATRMGIEALVWYCYQDSKQESLQGASSVDSEGFFGLCKHGGTWKPAAHAYSLFSKNCSNSEIRQDLVDVSGGLAARQLRTALYRRDDGESTLIMWFEPGLRRGAHARVTLDLGPLDGQAISHSITSSDAKPVLDKVVTVTETPMLITFKTTDPDSPVGLAAVTSPGDMAWLVLAGCLILASAFAIARKETVCCQ
ncbi:MAG: hypothetical protein GY851_24020 [bacterium]|nr:hypothetical protein [bacterium]